MFSFLRSVMVILHVFSDFSMTVRSVNVDRCRSTRVTECRDGFKQSGTCKVCRGYVGRCRTCDGAVVRTAVRRELFEVKNFHSSVE